MPYCENCGNQINPNAKFCGNCGTPRNQTTTENKTPPTQPAKPTPQEQTKKQKLSYYSPPTNTTYTATTAQPIMQPQQQPQMQPQTQPRMQPTPTPVPQTTGEAVIGVLLLRRMKSLGRYDAYTGVVTNQRMIFAQMTSQMLTTASQQARTQAKADGKGFFGQWSDQLKATFGFTQRYLTMQPDAIIAETPGNFALYNNTISEIKVHLKGDNNYENQRRELQVDFNSTYGKYEFHMDENSDFTDLLKQVYRERVKMPFGYFSKSINIKF